MTPWLHLRVWRSLSTGDDVESSESSGNGIPWTSTWFGPMKITPRFAAPLAELSSRCRIGFPPQALQPQPVLCARKPPGIDDAGAAARDLGTARPRRLRRGMRDIVEGGSRGVGAERWQNPTMDGGERSAWQGAKILFHATVGVFERIP